MKARQPVKLHGVDVRIMNEEQAWHLNRMKMKQNIHIAWDLPRLDLTCETLQDNLLRADRIQFDR